MNDYEWGAYCWRRDCVYVVGMLIGAVLAGGLIGLAVGVFV